MDMEEEDKKENEEAPKERSILTRSMKIITFIIYT